MVAWRVATVAAVLGVRFSLCASMQVTLAQYVHTSWSPRSGSPVSNVRTIAQDRYLWLGSDRGLLRFDGVRFVAARNISGEDLALSDITNLHAHQGGGLWIAGRSRFGVMTSDGQFHLQGLAAGRVSNWIVSMAEDRAGNLWAGSPQAGPESLVVVRDGSGAATSISNKALLSGVYAVFQDRQNQIWVGISGGFCRFAGSVALPASSAHCFQLGSASRIVAFSEWAGGLLAADAGMRKILRISGDAIETVIGQWGAEPPVITNLLADRDGNLWIGTLGQGIYRLHDGAIERFCRRDGLTSDLVQSIIEDREGNVWVGTAAGLDRFRKPKVFRFSTADGLSGNLITAVLADRTGAVWVGTTSGLNVFREGRFQASAVRDGLPRATVVALHEDEAGRIWVSTNAGVFCRSDRGFAHVPSARGEPATHILAIASRSANDIWMADAREGLMHVNLGRIEPANLPLPAAGIYQLYSARNGDLWIGYFKGGVYRLRNGSVEHIDSRNGPAVGTVQTITEDSEGAIWIGTNSGLSRFHKGQWTTWDVSHGLPEGGVQGFVEAVSGGFWLATVAGLGRIPSGDFLRPPSPHTLSPVFFGPSDGVQFPEGRRMANPRITQSREGRIWISTEDGLATLDQSRLSANLLPPPVVIEQIVVDGKPLSLTAQPLAFRAREVQFDYTALSFSNPEAVRFRYKLEGAGTSWIEAGARRQIVYSHLSPGPYRFRVVAGSDDGQWTEIGDALAFRLEPYFYQSWSFKLLCSILLLTSGFALHWVRISSLRSKFRLVLQERTRLTRELHDTVLQGFAGVVYQLDAASRRLEGASETTQRRVRNALSQADRSLTEARHMLSCLRLSGLESDNLADSIFESAEQIVDGAPISLDTRVTGANRPLPYDVKANLYVIAREATYNAVNHSSCSRISIELEYSATRIRLMVADDGIGFEKDAVKAKVNHWGLSGMNERASQLGANFFLDTSPGRGTRIHVTVPLRESAAAAIRRIARKRGASSPSPATALRRP